MRTRFAILAMIGLLWSQLVLAAHPLCAMMATTMPDVAANTADAEAGCHHEDARQADILCEAHCSHGDLSKDTVRVPAVPALAASVPVAIATFVVLRADPIRHPRLPPPASWHRPTPHPAALLLI